MKTSRGFSLLEVLVASAIFAVVAALAWGGLEVVARQRRVLDEETSQWQQLQQAVARIERDLRQAVPASVTTGAGVSRPALLGRAEDLSLLTASGAEVTAVAWACRDGSLWRRSATRFIADDRPVLSGLVACDWSYRGDGDTRASTWQPPMPESLPRAIELHLVSARFGEIRRLVELPTTPQVAR